MSTQSKDIAAQLALFLLGETGSIFGSFDGRIPAKQQRELFGYAAAGKCRVQIDGATERLTIRKMVCFGTDCSIINYTWSEVADRIARRYRLLN